MTKTFYKAIQNTFYYAITEQIATEIVYNRVDSKKENMDFTILKVCPI